MPEGQGPVTLRKRWLAVRVWKSYRNWRGFSTASRWNCLMWALYVNLPGWFPMPRKGWDEKK